jgi:hypothetical protein
MQQQEQHWLAQRILQNEGLNVLSPQVPGHQAVDSLLYPVVHLTSVQMPTVNTLGMPTTCSLTPVLGTKPELPATAALVATSVQVPQADTSLEVCSIFAHGCSEPVRLHLSNDQAAVSSTGRVAQDACSSLSVVTSPTPGDQSTGQVSALVQNQPPTSAPGMNMLTAAEAAAGGEAMPATVASAAEVLTADQGLLSDADAAVGQSGGTGEAPSAAADKQLTASSTPAGDGPALLQEACNFVEGSCDGEEEEEQHERSCIAAAAAAVCAPDPGGAGPGALFDEACSSGDGASHGNSLPPGSSQTSKLPSKKRKKHRKGRKGKKQT